MLIHCHMCGSERHQPVLADLERGLELARCRSCRLVFLAGWRESLARSQDLYSYYDRMGEAELLARQSPENRGRQRQLLQELAGLVTSRRLLDVGCGDGQLLRTAFEQGWEGFGVDLSEGAVGLCRTAGLEAEVLDFFDEALDARRFDVVVMSELLEHVPAPQTFIKRASQLLAPGGVLYLTTPNFGSLARRALGESWSVVHAEHIGYFERDTLRAAACEGSGLREIKIEANNLSPSTLIAWLRARRASDEKARAAEAHREMRTGIDQRLRSTLNSHPALGAAKQLVNRAVSWAGIGETLVAWFEKPRA